MSQKINCILCDRLFTNNNSYIGSHVKRIHKLSLNDYVIKNYKNLNPEFVIEKCGFCDFDALPYLDIDHNNKTYNINYINGYFCNRDVCKNNISLEILHMEYNKSKYEHIGSNSEYLSKLYKKDIKEVNKTKARGVIGSTWKSSLSGYIDKYGEIDGEKLYKQRCNKISKANSELYYIDKYGEIEGKEKWKKYTYNQSYKNKIEYYIEVYGKDEGIKLYNERIKKQISHSGGKSKISGTIGIFLQSLEIPYEMEYNIIYDKKNYFVDYYLPKYNIIIEFFGDYWHANPNIYSHDYYNKKIKMFASEIWKKDYSRLYNIKSCIDDVTILKIWESTKMTPEYLIKLLNEIKNKKTIFEI